jgi:hypothetical protein
MVDTVSGHNSPQLLFPPIGTRVRLDRSVDRVRPCCDNIAVIDHGRGLHAAALRCVRCHRHRGWLPHEAFAFISNITQKFGAPDAPIILRDRQIGDHQMVSGEYDNTNSGALFKNDDKQTDKHPDYRGSINVDGTDYWLSAWLKTSKKGIRFMSLAVKPKEDPNSKPKPEFDDRVPF